MMMFKTNMRALRKAEHLTQDELADRTGVSKDTVKRLESDRYKIPPYPAIYMIAKYFDKPVEDVFWYEEA